MPRGTKDGSIIKLADGRFVVRKRYTDLKGRRREKKRFAVTPGECRGLRRIIEREIEDELAGLVRCESAPTFAEVVSYCRSRDLRPAEYVGQTKIAGLRSWRSVESLLKPLLRFFGSMAIGAIAYDDLEDYKRIRLRGLTSRGLPRSVTSVNRELAQARRLFFVALREKWIAENPFHRGKPLIQVADEPKRMRILTWREEEELLAACTGRRAHLRLEILFALETALRHNEQFTLEISDVDLAEGVISLRAWNSKTAQTRVIPIFARLRAELEPLSLLRGRCGLTLLFDVRNSKHAFATACRVAGIEGLRWHDLRHTAITRMLHHYQIPAATVMKISGHSNWKTFLRYVNVDREVARSVAARVDAVRAELAQRPILESAQESNLLN